MWEDPQNCDGGRWVLNLDKKFRNTSLDVYWLNTVRLKLMANWSAIISF